MFQGRCFVWSCGCYDWFMPLLGVSNRPTILNRLELILITFAVPFFILTPSVVLHKCLDVLCTMPQLFLFYFMTFDT